MSEAAERLRSVARDVLDEYKRAARKHPGKTLDELGVSDLHRLSALFEEAGEVAKALTYDQDRAGLRDELVQLAGLAMAWAAGLDRQEAGDD